MSATCYFASGKNADLSGSTYIPCNATAVAQGGHSACCAPDDMCFTNGLCKAGSDDQFNWNWRVGCTDPTFSDPACPSYCQGMDSDNAAHLVFQCADNENWCCATGNPDNFARNYNFTCCSHDELKLDLGPAVYYGRAKISIAISTLESSSSTSTKTQTSSTPTTSDVQQTSASTIDAATFVSQSAVPTSTSTSTDPPKSSPSSSTALAAGLGVGIPVALILMGLIAFFFYRLGQRHNHQGHAQEKDVHLEHPEREELSDETRSPEILVDAGYSDGSQHNEAALLRGLQFGDPGSASEMANQRSPVELEGKRLL